MGSSDADRDWLRRDNTVLMQVHGASVLGLGLVAISAAQFEYADPRYTFLLLFLGSVVAYSNDLQQRLTKSRNVCPQEYDCKVHAGASHIAELCPVARLETGIHYKSPSMPRQPYLCFRS